MNSATPQLQCLALLQFANLPLLDAFRGLPSRSSHTLIKDCARQEPSTMAPSHLLRATMPLRSIASPMSLTRSMIVPSTFFLTQTIRYNSTTTTKVTPEHITTPPTSNTTSIPTLPKSQTLKPPTLLRDYASSIKTGTVVSVGRMDRTVTVVYRSNEWDKHIRKYYQKENKKLVSDPQNSLRTGDVIEFSSGAPKSRHVHHVVERIITPFAVPIEDRPAVLTRQEREQEREKRWAAKYVRRESRRLGEEIDLQAIAQEEGLVQEGETLSTAALIHRIFLGQERIGKVKKLVQERTAEVQV
ncbi:uncharacterized protein N7482_000206 [Penicillium canariense]|uniref:Ribosomal protein S17 n=1 Tax=Penicillium canariense TaxID=189055 RepID=A0A9W9IDR9_9EURO|nr:uncharacterized protein N7482_000206 [Penicillium canariense]KAJ5174329.1 hypothetical protein N7482_000206 [Penicillium canariense]